MDEDWEFAHEVNNQYVANKFYRQDDNQLAEYQEEQKKEEDYDEWVKVKKNNKKINLKNFDLDEDIDGPYQDKYDEDPMKL